MSPSRVAVTGLGAITGLGLDLESTWQGVLAGKSPIKRFTSFDPQGLRCQFGVELPEGASELFKTRVKKRRRSQMTRSTMMAVVASQMAVQSSGLDLRDTDLTRMGVVAGATGTGYMAPPKGQTDQHRILRNMASAPAAWISLDNKVQGPSFVVSTACASGAYALASAHGLIASKTCDLVIAGSAESSLNFLDAEGFASLLALSESSECIEVASRPFDLHRDGFVMGEGAGFLLLESVEHAKGRNAEILALVSQPGLSSEAYNILSPAPGGAGMARTMSKALENAGLRSSEIDYINAHGTSTQLNDLYETQAIKEVFGAGAYSVPVSSTKSMTGHCLSGAAGVEAVLSCKALMENTIPPTAHLETPDPDLDLDYVPLTPRKTQLTHVMSNSFAFGGHNGVCIFSKADTV